MKTAMILMALSLRVESASLTEENALLQTGRVSKPAAFELSGTDQSPPEIKGKLQDPYFSATGDHLFAGFPMPAYAVPIGGPVQMKPCTRKQEQDGPIGPKFADGKDVGKLVHGASGKQLSEVQAAERIQRGFRVSMQNKRENGGAQWEERTWKTLQDEEMGREADHKMVETFRAQGTFKTPALNRDPKFDDKYKEAKEEWLKTAKKHKSGDEEYVHTGKSVDTPCQRCIEESDPGVYERDKTRWESFPSFERGECGGMTGTCRKAAKKTQNAHFEFAGSRNEWWGAGHMCCRLLEPEDIEKQPLCGICLRYHANALGGKWSLKGTCAKTYCQPDGLDTQFKIDDGYMKKLADECGGEVDLDGHSGDYDKKAIGNTAEGEMGRGSVFEVAPGRGGKPTAVGGYPTNYLAVVANNPRKKDLREVFLANKEVLVSDLQKKITGTGSSSKQCAEDLKEPRMMGGATTTSGPFGGDVQCGGIIAEDWVRARKFENNKWVPREKPLEPAIAGLVFLNDEREPHRLDIIALKKIIEYAMPENSFSFHEDWDPSPKQVIAKVAAINKREREAAESARAADAKGAERQRKIDGDVSGRQAVAFQNHVDRVTKAREHGKQSFRKSLW